MSIQALSEKLAQGDPEKGLVLGNKYWHDVRSRDDMDLLANQLRGGLSPLSR